MIEFHCLHFDELSLHQLYDLMKLRQEVFVVEQDCVYLDADDKDQDSWHLMGVDDQRQLLAYCRLVKKGVSYAGYPSIGRVITAEQGRGKGYGQLLIKEAIQQCEQLFGKTALKIGAQTYLLRFYQSFGFNPVGEEYLEDGIPHIHMIRPIQ